MHRVFLKRIIFMFCSFVLRFLCAIPRFAVNWLTMYSVSCIRLYFRLYFWWFLKIFGGFGFSLYFISLSRIGHQKLKTHVFGSVSSSSNRELTTTSGVAPPLVPSSPSSMYVCTVSVLVLEVECMWLYFGIYFLLCNLNATT